MYFRIKWLPNRATGNPYLYQQSGQRIGGKVVTKHEGYWGRADILYGHKIRRDSNYVVTDSTGKKFLGTHPSKKAALAQLAAIDASKERREEERVVPKSKITLPKVPKASASNRPPTSQAPRTLPSENKYPPLNKDQKEFVKKLQEFRKQEGAEVLAHKCYMCGKPFTRHESMVRGIGPECIQKIGKKTPWYEEKYKKKV